MKSLLFTHEQMNEYMGEALNEARCAATRNEVPVGAIIIQNNKIIARAHNQTECYQNPIMHAECVAIQQACAHLKNWRLTDCALFVTLEPCTMCIGAIQLARIPLLVFGAHEDRMGAVGSIYDLTTSNNQLRVVSGVRGVECAQLLADFFKARRD